MSVRTTQIVAVVAVLIGIAGVVVGISAKNGNTSDEEVSDSIKSELSAELGSSERKAGTAQAATNRRLTALEGQIEVLQAKNVALDKRIGALSDADDKLSSDLTADVTRLDSRITALNKRVDNLENANSGP